ncbi:hypothetical protein JL722_13506 [Aureococcus anophagefferens]|nr:hypothetical protein JL722_13506 [Aureococcus anophagefferens]
MTVKFFPLFFKNDCGMSPASVQGIYAAAFSPWPALRPRRRGSAKVTGRGQAPPPPLRPLRFGAMVVLFDRGFAAGRRIQLRPRAPEHLRGGGAGANAAKRVLVPVANGSEIELTCITDTLVRAGAEVTIASVEAGTTCVMSRGLTIVADARVDALEPTDWDLVVCPGGMPGAERLRDSEALDAILRAQDARGAPLAAVCASPAVVLQPKGLLDKRSATCYPAEPFVAALGAVADGDVVRDGHRSAGPSRSSGRAVSQERAHRVEIARASFLHERRLSTFAASSTSAPVRREQIDDARVVREEQRRFAAVVQCEIRIGATGEKPDHAALTFDDRSRGPGGAAAARGDAARGARAQAAPRPEPAPHPEPAAHRADLVPRSVGRGERCRRAARRRARRGPAPARHHRRGGERGRVHGRARVARVGLDDDAEDDDATYDVFVSHCKRLDASEDRAVWVADVCEGAGLTVFFDRSDLTDISAEALERSVKRSKCLVTVLDPTPSRASDDGDRHRWDAIKKWCGGHPHVFAKQAINYNKDYRTESKLRLLEAVRRALAEKRVAERPPLAHAASSRTVANRAAAVRVGGSYEVVYSEAPSPDVVRERVAAARAVGRTEPPAVSIVLTTYGTETTCLAGIQAALGEDAHLVGGSCSLANPPGVAASPGGGDRDACAPSGVALLLCWPTAICASAFVSGAGPKPGADDGAARASLAPGAAASPAPRRRA